MTTKQVQLLLLFLGYCAGAADGICGPKTEQAVREFQRDFGSLEVDGRAGEKTQWALRKAVGDGWKKPEKPDLALPSAAEPDWWKDIRFFKRTDAYIGCSCGKCGGFPAEPEKKLMKLADRIRERFGAPMIPTSTVRCRQHNTAVGGVANSRHLLGKAMDFKIRGYGAEEILEYVKKQTDVRYAYMVNSQTVHMDIQ